MRMSVWFVTYEKDPYKAYRYLWTNEMRTFDKIEMLIVEVQNCLKNSVILRFS
jgi:hypothetical protein